MVDDADLARLHARLRHRLAGTTLVGQSIGAGARDWALRVGNRTILLGRALHGRRSGSLIALDGPLAAAVLHRRARCGGAAPRWRSGERLLWLAAAFQFFDGLNMGSGMCLRGAGDVKVPAALVLPMSLLFVRAARACAHLRAGAGLGAFPAAVRLRCRRRLGGGAALRDGPRQRALSALALRAWQRIRL